PLGATMALLARSSAPAGGALPSALIVTAPPGGRAATRSPAPRLAAVRPAGHAAPPSVVQLSVHGTSHGRPAVFSALVVSAGAQLWETNSYTSGAPGDVSDPGKANQAWRSPPGVVEVGEHIATPSEA